MAAIWWTRRAARFRWLAIRPGRSSFNSTTKTGQTYLEDRQNRGFNSIIVNLLEHKFCTLAPRTRSGLAPFHTPGDFSTPNSAYFDLAHQVVERAGEHGMIVWLAPAYLGYGGGDAGSFREIKAGGREKLRAYGRFVGKRFKDLPNIVWMLGGDYTPDAPDQWVVNDLAAAIREEDPTHLMTAHHSPRSSAVEAFGEQDWLTVNNFYGYEKAMFLPMLAEYRRKPVRPFVLIETTYEDEHDATPDQIRRQAYWAMLSGACGQFFGNNPIWHFDGPGIYPAKMTWQQALGATGSARHVHSAGVVYPPALAATGAGGRSQHCYCGLRQRHRHGAHRGHGRWKALRYLYSRKRHGRERIDHRDGPLREACRGAVV